MIHLSSRPSHMLEVDSQTDSYPLLLPTASLLPVGQFHPPKEHNPQLIKLNHEVPQQQVIQFSLLSCFKNEEHSCGHLLMGLTVTWFISTC